MSSLVYTKASISLPNRQFTQEFLLCCWCRCQRRRVVNLTDFKYCQERRTMDIFLRQIAISCKSRTVRQRHSHIRPQECSLRGRLYRIRCVIERIKQLCVNVSEAGKKLRVLSARKCGSIHSRSFATDRQKAPPMNTIRHEMLY